MGISFHKFLDDMASLNEEIETIVDRFSEVDSLWESKIFDDAKTMYSVITDIMCGAPAAKRLMAYSNNQRSLVNLIVKDEMLTELPEEVQGSIMDLKTHVDALNRAVFKLHQVAFDFTLNKERALEVYNNEEDVFRVNSLISDIEDYVYKASSTRDQIDKMVGHSILMNSFKFIAFGMTGS